MSDISIRYATKEDAMAIAALSRKTFYESFAAQNTAEDMEKFMRESFSEERLIAQVGAPGNIFLMAYSGTELVGYVRMLYGFNPPELEDLPAIEIARIYADASVIGKGVGSALMKRCIELATDMKNKSVWLGVWEKNDRAIAFYKKWGFEKFSEHDFVLGDDVQRDWLMRKLL
ncbi:GNAT family N-acetyltransferase [Pseudoflavitalea sp. G-6-1-2]|uniref:GNAT family N-acetyltransferase n=1 Tax=Pseudoflavitalea sp. G-6-1-2 TaxID=2728841 RepID=UPI00146B0A82|nr:GNAT family N-acetyltransferase [Pseudoflavitalea sp. G-6-1-2]NML21562.1 GNAT family N-acetyltransferase [Pseudoflavitalea sp. G-6-1-2]